MRLSDFSKRCLMGTFCLALLMYFFYPKYEFLDSTHRVNKVTGSSEYYYKGSYPYGWGSYD